jgi:hypothetical protein
LDSAKDGTRPFDANEYVSKLEWHQTPGYQFLDESAQDITKASYAEAIFVGVFAGFVTTIIINLIGKYLFDAQVPQILIYMMVIFALIFVGLKYYYMRTVVRINESEGVDFLKPTDNSWRYGAIIIVGAIVLHNTRPTDQALLNVIDEELAIGIANGSISQNDGIGEVLVKLGCKIYSTECAKLVRATLDIGVSDLIVIRIAKIKLDKDEAYCFGALNRWFCQL